MTGGPYGDWSPDMKTLQRWKGGSKSQFGTLTGWTPLPENPTAAADGFTASRVAATSSTGIDITSDEYRPRADA